MKLKATDGNFLIHVTVVMIHVKLAFRCIAYPQYVDMQTCQIDSITVPILIEKEKY